MRFTNHLEKRLFFIFSVNRELGVENLMAAVLGIGLRKHHQFHICRISALRLKSFDKVIDFILGKRQAHLNIGFA